MLNNPGPSDANYQAETTSGRENAPASHSLDQSPAPKRYAFLYAATCRTLRDLSEQVGFDVLHLGVSEDPLTRVACLRDHASLAYVLEPFDQDSGDCEWSLSAIAKGVELPIGFHPWAGAVRFELPAGASSEEVARRLLAFLAPLDVITCAQMPSALQMRWMTSKSLPVVARYTAVCGRPKLAGDLFCVDDVRDDAYVIRALAATLQTLGPGRSAFDPVFSVLEQAPRLDERFSPCDVAAL